MSRDRFECIRRVYAEACALAPALRARFATAGLKPEGIYGWAELTRLPVLKKETLLARGWPMIRFGTGDVSTALEIGADGGATKIAPLQGRVGQAVKAREIFIYPSHVEALPRHVGGLLRAAVTVQRSRNRDEIAARIVLAAGADAAGVDAQLRQGFLRLTRLRLDRVEFVPDSALPDGIPLLSDARYAALRSTQS